MHLGNWCTILPNMHYNDVKIFYIDYVIDPSYVFEPCSVEVL